jgi:hypothetical protein
VALVTTVVVVAVSEGLAAVPGPDAGDEVSPLRPTGTEQVMAVLFAVVLFLLVFVVHRWITRLRR